MTNETIDMRDQMVRSLKGEYLEGFHFAYEEDDTRSIASLTNSVATKIIALAEATTNLTIKYLLVKQKNAHAGTLTKLELVKTGTELSFVTTDIATGKVINELLIPPPVHHKPHDEPFDTLGECLAEFDASDFQAGLQAEANRTCENQITHVTCCLTDGSCWSVVLIIKPSSWRCWRSVALPNSGVFKLIGNQ